MQRIRDFRALYTALAVVVALATATSAFSQAWAGRGRVRGKVTGPDGQPLEGVSVQLLKDGVEGEGPPPFKTDKKGNWSYLGLAGGNYTILLDYEGLLPSEGQVKVSEFGAGPVVKVQMKEIPKEVLEQAAADERRTLLDQGNAYLMEGKYAEARAAYEEVLGQIDESQHPPLLQGIARTHYEEKNLDAAIAALERALAIVPDDEATLKLAVNLLVAEGREDEARKYMDRLPEGAGIDADTVLNLGIQRYNENDYAGALEYFDRAAKENADRPEVFYYRGLAYLGSGDNEAALADFKKTLEIDPAYKAEEIGQFIEYLESESGDSQG